MKPLRFTAAGHPRTKGSLKPRFRRGGLFAGLVEDLSTTGPWMETVGWAAKGKGARPIPAETPVAVSLLFRLPRPQSHLTAAGAFSTRATDLPTRHSTGDLDKLVRAVLDALNGIAWADDAQVVEILTRKTWATDDEQPGVDVTVSPAEV